MDNYYHQHKLKEGQWYDFIILKSTAIDDDEYYVLETPLNTKMLLPKEPYADYGFKDNQTIHCKVDKISCSGKIYIEPKHPFYNINETYLFPLMDVVKIQNLYHQFTDFVVVKDKLNQLIYLPLWQNKEDLNNEIELRIIRIKKSKVFALPLIAPFDYKPIDKEWLDLKIINAFEVPNDGSYYLLEDIYKRWHLAPIKYFGKSLLPFGFSIRATISKYKTNDYYHLQFEHPKFTYQSEMYFDIISEETIETDLGENVWQISIKIEDVLQNIILPLTSKVEGNRILLKVGLIRKGKLTLEAL
ncbi:MAG: hypothetical protein WCP69_12800 [Bacteroidota bacterium]